MNKEMILIILAFIVGYAIISLIMGPKKINKSQSNSSNHTNFDKENDTKNSNKLKYWYEILEVPQTASLPEIKNAYRNKMKEYHPDRVSGLGEEFRILAEEKSKEINMAYEKATQTN